LVDVGAVTLEGGLKIHIYASDVVGVVVVFFGHLDGEEQVLGDPGADGVILASPRSPSPGLARGHLAVRDIGIA
jgi:hypothetical protein